MADLLRQGQATERDVATATARVAMDDLNGTVSGKMQVLFPAIGGWNCFWTPKEGDHVVISRLPNGASEGYIQGKVYTGNKMPQGGKPNIILLVSDDGKNVIRFDADKGTLDLVVDQDYSTKANNLIIEIKENVTQLVEGDTTSDVKGNVSEKAGGDSTYEADGKYTAKAKGKNTFELNDAITLKTSGAGLIEFGNSVDTLGNIVDTLLTALENLATEGSPAAHTAKTWATANITPLKQKAAQVLKK